MSKVKMPAKPNYVSTTNACKLCTPLGASMAFRGVEGAIPFLHGSANGYICQFREVHGPTNTIELYFPRRDRR